MERIAMTDRSGKWFDKEKAQEFDEGTTHNGNNFISNATGSQTEHEILYRTVSGKWVLHSWSQWQGTIDTWQIVSEKIAAAWLVTNGRTKEIKSLEEQIAQLEF